MRFPMQAGDAIKAGLTAAKLTPPKLPPSSVDRTASLLTGEQLSKSRLVLVQAPAGYGKTTWMVYQMLALQRSGYRTVWLTLDEDDDPDSFVAHLAAAIADMHGDPRLNALHRPPTTVTGVMASLLHAIHEIQDPVGIFVDEVDAPINPATLSELDRFIERIPMRHTIFLAARSKPGLRLARFRVRGEVSEIGVSRLGFGRQEVAQYFCNSGIDGLDDGCIGDIYERTEGWPVAVQMVAHVVKTSPDLEELLDQLASSDIGISDYLAEEILAQQTPEMRDFMLRSSVLRNLHPDICNLITGRNDSQQIMQNLLRKNLFVVQLGSGGWIRYHKIFRDFLYYQLSVLPGGTAAQVHARAALALADMEIYNEAIENAILAGDRSLLAAFIATHGGLAIRKGNAARIAAWARQHPISDWAQNPEVLVVTAWAHMLTRDIARSRAEIDILRGLIDTDRMSEPGRLSLAMLEVTLAMVTSDIDAGLDMSDRYLRDVAKERSFERGVISNVSGYAEILRGKFDRARQHLAEGRECHAHVGSSFGQAFSICYRGLLEAIQGRLNAALRIYARASAIDPNIRESTSRAVVDSFAADVLYEQNRIQESKDKLSYSLPMASEFAYSGIVSLGHLTMVRLIAAEGDYKGALRLLEEAEEEGIRRDYPRLVHTMQWERVRLAIALGDLAEANVVASHIQRREHGRGGGAMYLFYPEELEATDIGGYRLMIYNGNIALALSMIERALAKADAMKRVWRGIKLRVLKSIALQARGDMEPALRALRDVLSTTDRENFIRTYLDEGPIAVAMLRQIRERHVDATSGISPLGIEYLDRILGANGSSSSIDAPTPAAIQVLSDRENAIVSCLVQGLSNKQISAQLFLSENTVKWHLRNIYEKLGVRSRTSAIATLRRKGLI